MNFYEKYKLNCSVCGEPAAAVHNSPFPVPYSGAYCTTCSKSGSERIEVCFLYLKMDFEKNSRQSHVTGYIDGIRIPMETVVRLYQMTTALALKGKN